MNESEVIYEADEYDRASVEFLASEFMTKGIYILKDGKRTKHKYSSFAEAKAAAERMIR